VPFLHLQFIPPQLPLIGLNNKPNDMPEATNAMNIIVVSRNISIMLFIRQKRSRSSPFYRCAKD